MDVSLPPSLLEIYSVPNNKKTLDGKIFRLGIWGREKPGIKVGTSGDVGREKMGFEIRDDKKRDGKNCLGRDS